MTWDLGAGLFIVYPFNIVVIEINTLTVRK